MNTDMDYERRQPNIERIHFNFILLNIYFIALKILLFFNFQHDTDPFVLRIFGSPDCGFLNRKLGANIRVKLIESTITYSR